MSSLLPINVVCAAVAIRVIVCHDVADVSLRAHDLLDRLTRYATLMRKARSSHGRRALE